MDTLAKKTKTNTHFVLLSQAIVKTGGIASIIVLAKFLSIEEYGIYSFITSSILIFSFLTNLGLGSSLQRFIAEYAKFNLNKKIISTLVFGQLFRAIIGLLIIITGIFLFDYFSPLFKIQGYKFEYILFCISSFFFFQIEFLLIAFNASFKHKYSAFSQAVFLSIRVSLIFLFLLLDLGLRFVFIAEIIAYISGFLLLQFLFLKTQKIFDEKIRVSFQIIEWKRILKFSGYSALTIPGTILFSYSLDYFVIASLASQFSLGLYSFASRVSSMVFALMPQNILQALIRPAFFQKYYSDENKEESLNNMFQFLIKLFAITNFLVIAISLGVFKNALEAIFGTKYSGAEQIFGVILFFGIFRIFELPSDLIIQTLEKVHARLIAQISAVYNLIAAILLVKKFGIFGVAIATSTALMFKSLILLYLAKKYSNVKIPVGPLIKILFSSILAFIVIKLLQTIFTFTYFFILNSIVGILVYLFVLFLINPINKSDKILINRFFNKKLFRI